MALAFQIIRTDRKTLGLQITPQGQVIAHAPRQMSTDEIRRFVESKGPWIAKNLQKIHSRPKLPTLTPAQLELLAHRAVQVIPARAAHYAPLVGVTYGKITLRNQRTRWGSCSGAGNLNFNVLLMLAPPEVLDYVVVHELCHRLEMNHSPRFWAEVARVLPDYQVCLQWLKENGPALIESGTASKNP